MNEITRKAKNSCLRLCGNLAPLPFGRGWGWVLGLLLVLITSCSEWDGHYDGTSVNTEGASLYDLLASNSETRGFAELVSQAGLAEALSSSQTYTVFAPSTEATAAVDKTDQAAVRRFVNNHIARYSNPTSTPAGEGVRMLNDKLYSFSSPTAFASVPISSGNVQAANGLIHRLTGSIPYAYNLYEFIQTHDDYSELYRFIHRFDETRIDEEHSTEIDIDDQGRPVYDTILVAYNRLLQDRDYGIGYIATEDSTYTMILPDNHAWQQAYKRIAPSFVNYHADAAVADSIQDVRTGLAIVSNLVYRGNISHPADEDSLVSTTQGIMRKPSELFAGTSRLSMSNGEGFLCSMLNYDNRETWNQPISVEAEEQNGRQYNNTQTVVNTLNVTSNSLISGVSGDSYIEVMPLTTSTNPTIIFDIPQVLAGAYNIYAVFLPSTVAGPTEEMDSTKISFSLTYLNDKGRTSTKRNTDAANLTSPTGVVKMLAFEAFEFPVSDYTDALWLMDEQNDPTQVKTTTQLSISTNVATKDYTARIFSRTFRLDRIILEPVAK